MIRRFVLAALLLIPLLGSAPQTWVNIKDSAIPGGPATGNGSTDDTAAIQAAIDYAFNNGYTGVYCPAGSYKTTNTLWLDPPATSGGSSWPGAGMRKQTWGGTGYFSSGAFFVSTTTSGAIGNGYVYGTNATTEPIVIIGGNASMTASIDNGSGSTGNILTVSAIPTGSLAIGDTVVYSGSPSAEKILAQFTGTSGKTGTYLVSVSTLATSQAMTTAWTINDGSFSQGSSGSPVTLTATTPSSPTTFSFSTSFFGDPASGGNTQGCKIKPTFSNAPAFLVGTGQGMRVSDIAVTSSAGGYRGNLSTSGVGIGLSGGNGGSSINLVENTYVANFYSLYKTDANGACCLNDSNTWRKVAGDNGYKGIDIEGTQSYIDDVVEPRLAATIDIYSPVGKAVNVYGGNLSAGSGHTGTFAISSISAFSKVSDGDGFDYSFTATVASPDSYIPNVYNSYTISTADFGVIPLTMTAWNAGSDVGTFQIRPGWVFSNYGIMDLTTGTDMQAEVAAVTTLYAAERVNVAWGEGISLDGTHIEDPSACSTLFFASIGFNGSLSNTVKNPYFNYDPSQAGAALPILYCQRTFPFIWQKSGGAIVLDGGTYGATEPVLVENDGNSVPSGISGRSLNGFKLNMAYSDDGGYAYAQKGGYGQWETESRGIGQWDNFYTLGSKPANGGIPRFWLAQGFVAPFCGTEPCPWTTPNISDEYFGFASVCPGASLSGSTYTCSALGTLGTYPPVPCRTFFALVDWNTSSLPNSRVRSASCPGWSWGQNLTNATTGGTVTWSYKGQSDVLYLDATSLNYMFPGLNIVLPDPTSGNDNYIVTGVFADLGYVTVIKANSDGGAPLAGVQTTIYSCSSSCTIGQNPFVWSAYQ